MKRILLLTATLGGCEYYPAATAIWPYPGATGLPFDSTLVIQHSGSLDRGVYGLERPYHLVGPGGAVPLSAALETDAYSARTLLRLTPDQPLLEGPHTLTVALGSDSNNFRSVYRAPDNLIGSTSFSTQSDPTALCVSWYDYDGGFITGTWAPGRQPCVHFSEPLVPGRVDLRLGQVVVDGVAVKASGAVPEEFPELLCALLPDEPEPLNWQITLEADDIEAVAGGALAQGEDGATVTVDEHTTTWCQSISWLLPRWRPDEEPD